MTNCIYCEKKLVSFRKKREFHQKCFKEGMDIIKRLYMINFECDKQKLTEHINSIPSDEEKIVWNKLLKKI